MQSPTRTKLIEAFSHANGEFLSGQALANILGCSRTAIWKHIEELRKEGFELEAIRNKGYRIISTPKNMTENELRLGLKTTIFGKTIQYLESTDSTQKVAHQLAQEGCPDGTLVIAEEQTNGRGRLARNWHSPKYTGIWMSLVLRPKLPPAKAPQFTLIAAVAVARAIEDICEISPDIKWPNDLLLNGKKITGILTELQADSDKINAIIMGIGMNVNQKEQDFPKELHNNATSLAIETGKEISRSELVKRILENLEKYYLLYLEKGFAPLKLLWESYAVSLGKDIIARTISGNISGKALGITEEGVLKIEDQNGQIHKIYSADIEMK
ncbi:biotin--acetyl-CoA-carboxylase ligase [Heyndrickxia shackletonii]|uniref:Bifunctional ligase/repressor BirA n=1 Tax=Heyndrickxia shackletonii TaxID=157838 RepID=A0A0Q3TIF7_9BACI|nr:biotin--[acetyl-CoA-carboxylase] ligase [Heyndrickxia shackletonii]KQL53728.1 biotin--acetyl-CoA-carboxylase ligase [Heyndrickxia shackletonii]MBB2481684.1 biotin--[acetyl-CoA-carboxylase] ligase [Bacillus sp. APMAM]NEY99868.1 biotin--[acetyl-CoA-carboxylase] ligase [Heyndrickxia shackletonii]RTZ54974.1 biotin--[acetyl-CoA-carboxylase] ligase [Bacillus sp. SAJ1]